MDRSPQRSGECGPNGSAHERLEGHPMDFHSQRILPDCPEVGPCHRHFCRHIFTRVGLIAVLVLLAWRMIYQKASPPAPQPAIPREEIIPPGIVVTESNTVVPPPPSSGDAPGDRMLGEYGNPNLPARNDVVALANAITNFLIIDKQATSRPLSANEEWSAALRGLRPGTEPWISAGSPAFDARSRLIDRWGTPLIFHALGGKQWEIRSAGPDRKPWNDDDLVEKFSG